MGTSILPLAVLALVPAAIQVNACVVVMPSEKVGTNFQVRLSSPVEGVPVLLSKGASLAARQYTDKQGIASFRNIKPGSYATYARHISAEGANIEVTRTVSSARVVTLTFPSYRPPVVVGSAKGQFRLARRFGDDAEPAFPVQIEGIDGKVLRRGTSVDGLVDLQFADPGLYFLVLDGGEGGEISIEIDPKARNEAFDFDLSWSSCGLTYTDLNECKHPELRLQRIEGVVTDVAEAAIERARVQLRSRDAAYSQVATTGRSGEIPTIQAPPGEYDLSVEAAGFSSLRESVRIGPDEDANSIQATLGIGQCSQAKLRPIRLESGVR